MEEKKDNSFMKKIATFIVDKRKAFFVLFLIAAIFGIVSMSKVSVNNDLTDYLPDTTETRQGLDIMDEEFVTFGNGKILIANIPYDKALELAHGMENIKGISAVNFYNEDDPDDTYKDDELEDYYKDSAALYTLTFDEEEDTELSQQAIKAVRTYIEDYDAYVYTTVDKDDAANLKEDMKLILVVIIITIIAVLMFTSSTYMEIVIFMLTFGMGAILNVGTNYWFGEISFISNAVGSVLQLALAIDYAIILFHRFMEEKEVLDTREALIEALSKAIPEISSSSLTTISGMVALMFMQFGIGMDLGRVLTKAIIFSLLSVFFFMPSLIMMFYKAIEKTRHKNFVPRINYWGKIVVGTRYIVLPIFICVVILGCIFASKCHYIYDINSIDSKKKNEYMAAKTRIEETFETTNAVAVVIPKGDYQKEKKITDALENVDEIDTVLGLSNIEVGDNDEYVLTDSLNPREFSEVADADVDTIKFVYRAYAIDQEQYGAFFSGMDEYEIPIVDLVDFIYDQKENGALQLNEETIQDIDDIHEDVCDAREQLEGEYYTRIAFTLKGPVEGDDTFAIIDRVRAVAETYYDEVYVVGDSTSDYDLSKSFKNDNNLISVLTALFVGIILLFTFQSAGIPFMLLLTIQGSIWINFSMPYLQNTTMFFLSYLIVSSIQMGATIDYAIVITSRYLQLRQSMDTKKEAIIEALNQAFPTVITSGTILTCAGFAIGALTSDPTIASLGATLGRGTLISIILVMTVLPQILLVGDFIIEKTAFAINRSKEDNDIQMKKSGSVQVYGHVKGYFAGEIDAKMEGQLVGDINFTIKSDDAGGCR